jgi:hypothetical protein
LAPFEAPYHSGRYLRGGMTFDLNIFFMFITCSCNNKTIAIIYL